METFNVSPGFCPCCGTIFPALQTNGNIVCYNCKRTFQPEVYGNHEIEYTIHFNNYNPEQKSLPVKKELKYQPKEADGPIVERKCPKCGHDQMSYATLQLRSADEGQTVFFTCLKCNYKESENS